MRFAKVFKRYVGDGEGSKLGADKVPEGAPKGSSENVLQLRSANMNGFPVQRLVIGYAGPAPVVKVAALVHDERSGQWFNTEPEQDAAVRNGRLAYVDLPTVGDLSRDDGGGAIEVVFIPELPKDAPRGCYTFAIGGDVSNPA